MIPVFGLYLLRLRQWQYISHYSFCATLTETSEAGAIHFCWLNITSVHLLFRIPSRSCSSSIDTALSSSTHPYHNAQVHLQIYLHLTLPPRQIHLHLHLPLPTRHPHLLPPHPTPRLRLLHPNDLPNRQEPPRPRPLAPRRRKHNSRPRHCQTLLQDPQKSSERIGTIHQRQPQLRRRLHQSLSGFNFISWPR